MKSKKCEKCKKNRWKIKGLNLCMKCYKNGEKTNA